METIIEAKNHLRENFEKGCTCPACGQFVKLYKRKFNSGLAVFLINIFKMKSLTGRNSFSSEEIRKHSGDLLRGTDYGIVRFWNVAEPVDANTSEKKKQNWNWSITERGELFVRGIQSIESHVFIYNNRLDGSSNEQINIFQALGNKFDYKELMNQ